MAVPKRVTVANLRWGAWAGTREDFERLVATVDGLVGACAGKGSPDMTGRRSNVPKAKRTASSGSGRDVRVGPLQVRIVQAGEDIEDAWQAALPALDTRTYSFIALEAALDAKSKNLPPDSRDGWSSPRSDFIRLTFNRRHVPGVHLRLRSAEREWASRTLWEVREEIGKSKPRWAWINSELGEVAFFFAVTASVYLVPMFLLFATDLKTVPVLAFAGAIAFLIGVSCTRLFNLRPWLFPPFEILADGAVAKGTRRLASFGGLIVAIVVSIGTNIVTD